MNSTEFLTESQESDKVVEQNKTMENIERKATQIISEKIPTICEKEIIPEGVKPQDYVSVTRFVMERNDKGNPVFTDGKLNPEAPKYTDKDRLGEARINIIYTTIAAVSAQEQGRNEEAEKFSKYAEEILRVWFIDENTKMSPNLEHSQMINGETDGNYWGIIEGSEIPVFINRIKVMERNGLVSQETQEITDGVKQWFEEYLEWLTTSEKGIRVKNEMKGNHATYYDAQVAEIADFLGKEDLVKETLKSAKRRIDSQIEASGEMPEEAKRVDSFGYRVFNLNGFRRLSQIGEKYGVDLWNYENDRGGSIKKAYEYLSNLLDQREREGLPSPFDESRIYPLYMAFTAAGKVYKNPKYFELPKKYFNVPEADIMTQEKFW